MSGRPGAKKSSQDKLKDKAYEEQKMRMLERAEKNLAKVSARAARPVHERRLTPARMRCARPLPQKNMKARELENWEKARAKLKDMCEPPPHERDLNEMSEGLLFIAELGKEDYLDEMTHRRFPVLITEHFKNAVVVSNLLYCIGACALASFQKKLLPPAKVSRARAHPQRAELLTR